MFTKKTIIVIGISLLAILPVIILSLSFKYNYTSLKEGRNIFVVVAAPFQNAVVATTKLGRDIWSDYFSLLSVARENKELKKKTEQFDSLNNKYCELKAGYNRLLKLLNFKRENPYDKLIAARVIGKDAARWFKTVLIDKGKKDGVKKGMPVITPEGAVGQITDIFARRSRVLLITEQHSAIDAIIQRTRARGILKGKGADEECALEYILRKNDVQIRDVVISSGMDGIFPKGLIIGTVSNVTKNAAQVFQNVSVSCYVDFEKLEEVLIIDTSGIDMRRFQNYAGQRNRLLR
ncbi:MAG: rod shape-determining protein MreC [Deltaproteobacteria bacterium]|nr:rod shape-determining protein MreC [Deltaproteobacteria bacterium]